MKASELIEELKKAIDKFGDLEVFSKADYEIIDMVNLEKTHKDRLWGECIEIQ